MERWSNASQGCGKGTTDSCQVSEQISGQRAPMLPSEPKSASAPGPRPQLVPPPPSWLLNQGSASMFSVPGHRAQRWRRHRCAADEAQEETLVLLQRPTNTSRKWRQSGFCGDGPSCSFSDSLVQVVCFSQTVLHL